jgi:indolepyruvate ferredoxin oxidoreductase beta subunit
VIYVDGEAAAAELGNIKAANVVLLGALSALMEREGLTGPELPAEIWLKVITERVPAKFVELNRQAFNLGRDAVNR